MSDGSGMAYTEPSIRSQRFQLLEKIDKAQKRFKKREEKMYQQLTLLQAKCIHVWDYYPDPSGNNDSGYVCSQCSKEVKRIP